MNPILAAGSGDVWMFVVVGVFVLIKWLASGGEKSSKTGKGSTNRPSSPSEQERTRRFLEALGLPPDGQAPGKSAPPPVPQRQEPSSLRQSGAPLTPPPPPPPRQAPPPVQPNFQQQQPRKKKQQQPKPKPEPAFEMPARDWLPEMTTQAEKVHVAELKVPEYHEFRTTTSEVHAIPFEKRAATVAETRAAKTFSASELRGLLRGGGSLRAAVVLREILGPPPGLQTR